MNDVIKSLFDGSTAKELHETLDMFWSKYTKFNHKNDPFDSNEFIHNNKDIYLVQPKMSPTLSFSGIYRKSFIYRSNRTNYQ